MSATSGPTSQFHQGVHSYRTRVKLVIHSHVTDKPLVLKQEIRSFSATKSMKSLGTLSVVFVPNKNYLNVIYPNDYINLYVDRGDDEGWTRIFFGFVDRIEESYAVSAEGTPQTSYTIAASDFSKAFDKTQIYFNPAIGPDRKDFDASWIGVPNLGGLLLRTKGVSSTGSPPDVLINNIFAMFGAGSQFVLPSGYTPAGANKSRERRKEFVVNRLRQTIIPTLPKGLQVEQYLSIIDRALKGRLPPGQLAKLKPADDTPEAKQKAAEAAAELTKILNSDLSTDELRQSRAILNTAEAKARPSLLDVLDVFTFCEREAIDGYTSDVTIWQKEGSILSFLMQQSNEAVNELFFDLRPVIESVFSPLASGDAWSREKDEIGENWDDDLCPGVQYVPALVFREYPFSTIDFVDANAVKLGLSGPNSTPLPVGKIQFGAIFSNSPNTKGRHVIEVDNINYEDNRPGSLQWILRPGQKHLDVAVIKNTEIISSTLGRSDAEHFNLTQYLTDGLLGGAARFYMHDIMPIVSPIGIARHGLRVREITSKFCRFDEHGLGTIAIPQNQTSSDADQGVDADAQEQKAERPAGAEFPIDPSIYHESSSYGWRDRIKQEGVYRFHHGEDLAAPLGTPVSAVTSGMVVAVAPSGTFSDYGNTIIIKHDEPYLGNIVFSVYAHLDNFHDSMKAGNPDRNRSKKLAAAPDLIREGTMKPFPIKVGDLLGTVGRTKGYDEKEQALILIKSGPHLHFEIIKAYPAKGKIPNQSFPAAVSASEGMPSVPDEATRARMNSFDPRQWFRAHGIDVVARGTFNPGEDVSDVSEDHTPPSKSDVPDTSVEQAPQVKNGNLDNGRIRSQVARWGLLDDHWYQHNIEYLSGSITMRGAPEIRVGYRLDIDDEDRPLSFYVEGVQHSWEYPGVMTTQLTVTRGQCNNPFPVYVLPYLKGYRPSDLQRKTGSRLGKFFAISAPSAARKGTFVSKDGVKNTHDATENPDSIYAEGKQSGTELLIPAGGSIDLEDVEKRENEQTKLDRQNAHQALKTSHITT